MMNSEHKTESTPIVLLNLKEVMGEVGIRSHVTIYRYMKEGDFPLPISVGPRSKRWIKSEVGSWLRSKIEARGA